MKTPAGSVKTSGDGKTVVYLCPGERLGAHGEVLGEELPRDGIVDGNGAQLDHASSLRG